MQERPAAKLRVVQNLLRANRFGERKTCGYHTDIADGAGIDHLFDPTHRRQEPGPHGFHAKHRVRLSRGGDLLSLPGIHGERFLYQYRLSRRKTYQCVLSMHAGRCRQI